MAKQKYYVVWKGRQTGIFTDWATTQASVSGFPGAKHKSFSTLKEAEQALQSPSTSSQATPGHQSTDPKKPKSNTKSAKAMKILAAVLDPTCDVHIYCDGACDPNPGEAGSGVAVYERGTLVELHYGYYISNGTNNIAELNALHQSLLIAKSKLDDGHKVQILSDSQYCVNAMTKWAAVWKRNDWKRKNGELKNAALIQEMFEVFSSIRRRIKLNHITAHAGIEGNELADRLSMLTLKEKITEFKSYDGPWDIEEILAMQSG